ncbi:hypothetical protein Cni_G16049 [Canna indica]|uniref:Uncharacterized protein n=1 Tax=Canna indica TaxID=4628 RepID=A0AAQ3KFF6_9LILI|nr:hypothetical protein Cni_G16049 [Canna indica]
MALQVGGKVDYIDSIKNGRLNWALKVVVVRLWNVSPMDNPNPNEINSVKMILQDSNGLDPLTTASMFSNAQCIGEKEVNGEDCFILKLCTDPQTLKARIEGPAEIIRHVLFGYFSQKTWLLTYMEDSHLTRIQSSVGGDVVYWETSINSSLDDYRPVEVKTPHGRTIESDVECEDDVGLEGDVTAQMSSSKRKLRIVKKEK